MATDFTLDLKETTSGDWITYLHTMLRKCGMTQVADPPGDTVEYETWSALSAFQRNHGITETKPNPEDQRQVSDDYEVVGPQTWAALENEANWVDVGSESQVYVELVSMEVSGTSILVAARNASQVVAKAHLHSDFLGFDVLKDGGWHNKELDRDVAPGVTYYIEFDETYLPAWHDGGENRHEVSLQLNFGEEGKEGRGHGAEAHYTITITESGATLEPARQRPAQEAVDASWRAQACRPCPRATGARRRPRPSSAASCSGQASPGSGPRRHGVERHDGSDIAASRSRAGRHGATAPRTRAQINAVNRRFRHTKWELLRSAYEPGVGTDDR